MGWTEVAAGLGTSTAIAGLKAAKHQMGKRQYKRLLANAVAQILELHPDIGPKKARRRAQRIAGARPSKKLMRPVEQVGLKEGAEGAVAAATAAGVAKVAGIFGSKLKEKFADDADDETGRQSAEGRDDGREDPYPEGIANVRH